ncbi:hypothetical protein sphantq_01974 [Sphingobium sp. AntQ-1]|uniref:hypothetical protein n=1 Tax=Sphingobium sp. AntQ-1 TaxID=2930091 RepID=UPI00234FB553|nr:hypothetical protein [Sphingobium sp. AntQ-1]WCP13545.1 hypothetical protein sphantq_01974 [Sphingobium sp. AntQ-1]
MSRKFGKMRRSLMDALADYTREYQHRIDNPKDPRFRAPQEKANGYADRMINRVGRRAIRRPVELQSFITDASGRGWSPGPELQAMAFAWLATAFFGMLGEITKTRRNQIRHIAHKLQYSYDAGVPSRFVGGFLHQIGGSQEVQRRRALEKGPRASVPVARPKPKLSDKALAARRRKVRRNISVAARRKRSPGARIGKRGL